MCVYIYVSLTRNTHALISCIYAHKILRIHKHWSTLVYLFVCLIIYLFVCHALLLYVNCSACAYTFILLNVCAHYCVYTSSMLPRLQSHTHEDIINVPTHQVCFYFCLCSVYCFMDAPTCLYTLCVFHYMYVCLLMIYLPMYMPFASIVIVLCRLQYLCLCESLYSWYDFLFLISRRPMWRSSCSWYPSCSR